MEQKFYDLDVKVTEIQSVVEKLQDEVHEKKGKKTTTDAFARVPRGQRSAAVLVTDTRANFHLHQLQLQCHRLQHLLHQLHLHRLMPSFLEFCLHHHLKTKPESRSSTMHFL